MILILIAIPGDAMIWYARICFCVHIHCNSRWCIPFEWIRFEGIRIEGIRIEWIRIEGIRIEWIRIEGIRIEGICIEGIRIGGIRIEGIRIEGIRIEGMRMVGYVLKGYVLKRYVLTRCIVQNTPTIFRRTSGRHATCFIGTCNTSMLGWDLAHAGQLFHVCMASDPADFFFGGGSGLVCVVWVFWFGLVARLLLFGFGQQVVPLANSIRLYDADCHCRYGARSMEPEKIETGKLVLPHNCTNF